MNQQHGCQGDGKTPTKTAGKPSQNVPRKILGRWVRRAHRGASWPAVVEPTKFPFAPGVIDVGPVYALSPTWPEIVAAFIIGGAISLVVGFAAGYLDLPGWRL